MPIEIRVPEPDELRPVAETVAISLLHSPADDEAWATAKPSWESMSSVAAFDRDVDSGHRGGRPVGHAGQFLVETVVPGGARLATGAVSRVGILPTDRRRGVATLLMEALTADAVERSLPLMSLRASEAMIYRRFGFGVAGEYVTMAIDPTRARPVAGATSGGTITLVPPGEILDAVSSIYRRHLGCADVRRPGALVRPNSFWQRYFRSALERKDGSVVAVHHSPGRAEPDGYVHYDVAWVDDSSPDGKGAIHEVIATSPEVELALWDYLFGIDLVRRWTAWERPVDDLIRSAIPDRRAYETESVTDEQWLRLVDVDRCLSVRTYNPVEGAVVLAVTDPLVEANNRTWRLDAAGATTTDEPPQFTADIATVSAAYLGGTRWWALDATGRLSWAEGCGSDGDRRDVMAVADRLFASEPQPFCGSFF